MESESNTIKTADFIIYPDLGQVEVNNKTVRLGPVNMKVLVKLVDNPDKVVSRTELFDTVWNNQIISDDTLTKCISEIRTKLGEHTNHHKLILTVPKKGYQWNPSATEKPTSTPQKKINFRSYINSLLLIGISVMVLTTSFLWVANKLTQIKHVPILLLPIEIDDDDLNSHNINFEDSLRKNILKTQNIRFLSKLALLESSQYSMIYRNHNYQALWAIEGRIRRLKDKLRFTLNLIDTRTGLEVYSKSMEAENSQNVLDEFCLKFIKAIEQRINKQ